MDLVHELPTAHDDLLTQARLLQLGICSVEVSFSDGDSTRSAFDLPAIFVSPSDMRST